MNKKLIAMAIAAGLTVPGLAVADVKIFGVIQAETGDVDINDAGGVANRDFDTTLFGGGSGAINGGGPNQVGLKGEEKLGNGLTAYFKWNTVWDTDQWNSAVNTRDKFVGMKGDGWHVQFGTMNSTYKSASAAYDPFFTTGLQSRASGAYSGAHNAYADDVMEIGFKSGAWSGGFQITWEDSTGETKTAGNNNRVDSGSWNAAVKYAANNWELGFAYIDMEYENAATPASFTFSTTTGLAVPVAARAASSGDADMWKIHGKYSTNGWTITAMYEDGDADTTAAMTGVSRPDGASSMFGLIPTTATGGLAGNAEDYDSLHLTVSYQFSDATSLHAKYANTDWNDVGGVAGADVDGDHWGIGVKHNFSKRTSIYGGYTDNDYDRSGAARDTDMDIWAVGLRHSF